MAEAGTVSAATFDDRATAVLAVTAFERVAVQDAVADEPRETGEQTRELTVGGAAKAIDAVTETPPEAAVTSTLASAVTAATEAENAAVDCPALTITVAGTVTLVALSLIVTVVSAATAADVVTVHAAVPAALKELGEQTSVLKRGAGLTLIAAVLLTPPVAAVIVALAAAVTAPPVAVKLAVAAPAAMFTEAGTLNVALLLLESVTLVAAVTLDDICTVHVVVALDRIDAGLQETELNTGDGVSIEIEPLDAVTANEPAEALAAFTFKT